MSNYWDKYSTKEKLFELGELSARRNRLMLDLIREVEPKDNEKLLKILSGEVVNVIELAYLCETIIT